MNEQLEQRLISSIDKVSEYVGQTESFVKEQAPLIVDEIIRVAIVKGILGVVLLLAMWIPIALWTRHCLKNKDDFDSYSLNWLGLFVSVIIALAISLPTMVEWVSPAIDAVCVPRLYVIEYLSRLINH